MVLLYSFQELLELVWGDLAVTCKYTRNVFEIILPYVFKGQIIYGIILDLIDSR